MRAIVTVVGVDRVGIIAQVSTLLAQHNINVLDISQTVLQQYFAMVMMVDASACPLPFDRLARALDEAGQEQGLSIRIQREEIFEAMHRI